MSIAITAASGQLGRLVLQQLVARGRGSDVVALGRSPETIPDLGVERRLADHDRQETLDAAFAGVDTLLLISGPVPGKRLAQHERVIAAAKRAGVGRIVYTSLLHADRSTLDLAADHLATERALRESGVPFTILRNGWYTENYTGSIPGALAGGAFLGSAGEGRISAAARVDFAEAAAVALTSDEYAGQVLELAGDEAWTLSDLAAELSRQAGRVIPYRNLPVAEYASALIGFGLPAGLAQAIAGWDADAARGALFDDSRTLSRIIGRPTTPLRESIRVALGAGR